MNEKPNAAPDEYNRKLRQQLEQEWADIQSLKRAAPAPDADAIMALVWALYRDPTHPEKRAALRAAVEQMEQTIKERDSELATAFDVIQESGDARERAEQEAADWKKYHAELAAASVETNEGLKELVDRLHAAEQEAAALRELLGVARGVIYELDEHNIHGRLLARIDAARATAAAAPGRPPSGCSTEAAS